MADYSSFRQRLDAVLRTLDVKQVSDFLIAEKQWDEGTPADPEFAMWMMIAGAPTLGELHERARQWLISHGHEAEANAVAGRGKQQAKTGKQGRPGAGKGQKRGNALPPFSGPKKDRRSFRGK